MATSTDTTINDAVHDHLVIHELCRIIIDTPEFQRLRNITQCGMSHLVYPTANHTRFEHSLGVAHFAKKFVDCLDYQTCFDHPGEKGPNNACESCELKLSKTEKIVVQIAGLCHDLGHGPFSHFWEAFVHKASKKEYKHEDLSASILMRTYQRIIQNNDVEKVFKKHGISESDIQLSCDIIQAKKDHPPSKNHLFEIIANETSGIDVDKMEYILRDSRQFGMPFSMDVNRIMFNARIIKDEEDGKTTIAYRDKIHGNIFDLFLARAKMHYLCYQHPTSKRIEAMLLDILCEADEHMKVPGAQSEFKMSSCHENLDAYLSLDNSILTKIQHSTDPNLQNAQNLITRMLERKLYTVLLEQVISPRDDGGISKNKDDEILKYLEKNPATQVLNYRVAYVYFKMGKVTTDPLKEVQFFDKDGHAVDYGKITKSLFSRFYAENSLFSYRAVYIYCTEDENEIESLESRKIIKSLEHVRENVKKIVSDVLCC